MNYIHHTRAAHDMLRHQPAATPYHVSLYWALFFAWNTARFPTALDLDHEATMKAAHIGNMKTYRATLRDLETWELLAYQPSLSKYTPSRCLLTVLPRAEVPPVNDATEGSSAPGATDSTQGRSAPGEVGSPRAEVPPVECSPRAEVPQVLLIGDKHCTKSKPHVVVNSGGAAAKKNEGSASPKNAGHSEGEGSAEVGADEDQPKAPKKKVAPKKKGVQTAAIRAAATAQANDTGSNRPTPEVPFSESAIARLPAFEAAFEGTDYALADLPFYHELVANWRDKKTGEPPRRKDWVATAKRFMLNDAHDNRLKLAPGTRRATGTDADYQDAGIPTTGYRSSRYD